MMYLKLAWRNMWRSRRRTAITISSIFFAVVLAILMRTLMVGIFDKMISDTVSISCGYLQVHHIGYWANKSVDSTFEESPALAGILNQEKEVTAWVPHLESFALASAGEQAKGILVTGIVPGKENRMSNLSRNLVAGKYLADSDRGIMIAEGLAGYLKLKLNDTVVLLGQGYHGEIAAGKYAITGILRLPIPEMNKSMAWLPMARCRDFLGTGNRLSSVSVMVSDRSRVEVLKTKLEAATTGNDYEIMTWNQMAPELEQFFQLKMGQNLIMSGILYLVIAFGIFGTMLMMLNERQHEFGILVAIGMKKHILAGVVVLEMVWMSVAGTLLGMVCAYPVVFFFRLHPIRLGGNWEKITTQFNFEPILQPSLNLSHFLFQGYVVLGIAVTLSLYAVVKIHRLNALSAINS